MEKLFPYWEDLGKLTGHENGVRAMIGRFGRELAEMSRLVDHIPQADRKHIYFESIHKRMKTFAPNAMAMFALKTAGGINVAADAKAVHGTNIAAYGKERILSHADEIDVFLAQRGAMNRVSKRKIREEGGFKAIKAVREGRIYIIDEKIVSRPTLRLLLGITEIGRFLYPTVFNDVSDLRGAKILARAQFAETNNRFFPDQPIHREDIAYNLFVGLDLPKSPDVRVEDVSEDSPYYSHSSVVSGLDIMKLSGGKFYPDHSVTGAEAYEILKKVLTLVKRRGN
jgi:hypothetical protein